MALRKKTILKILKYFGLTLLVFFIGSSIYMNHLGEKMYGGLTEKVDYNQFKPESGNIAIENINVLSPDGSRFIQNSSILIEQGRITTIDSLLKVPSNTTIINGTGKYLIPGFIDTHVHLFQSPNDLLLYIANGVTEIRELIGEESHLKWKKEIEEGRIGPKLHVATPRLGSFDTMEGLMMSYTQGYSNIQNAEDANKAIKNFHEQGYDGIKIYSQLNKESYIAISETAKELGMPIYGHVPWALTLTDVYEHNQEEIVHFEEIMNALGREFNPDRMIGGFEGRDAEFLEFVEKRSESVAKNLITNNIAITSTLWLTETFAKQPFDLKTELKNVELIYENPGISEWVSFIPQGLGWLPDVNRYRLPPNVNDEQIRRQKKYWNTYVKATELVARNLIAYGVTIMTGTDANLPPAVPGFSLHDEFIILQEVGMSPSQVIQAATAVPAKFLGSKSGKIVRGFDANLVILDENPLNDISNTKAINAVIKGGKVYTRAVLDEILAKVKQANDKSRKVNIEQYSDN